MVASASRDQTVRVFDIRAMKEYCILKGHKKEVCCTSLLPRPSPLLTHTHLPPSAVTWHPVHPLIVSGGSEGAILHWDLTIPDPTFSQTLSPPRATLSQAHDSNVWSLAFHPLGHLLVSASNDHTTRFWSRERPGDASSVFSGGGEKPPEVTDAGGQDDDDEAMVPGFSYAGAGGGAGGGWWGAKDEESADGAGYDQTGRRYTDSSGGDEFPGLGSSESAAAAGRQNGPLPSQEDMYPPVDDWSRGAGSGGGHGGEDWPGRGGGRQGRWAGRRGGRH